MTKLKAVPPRDNRPLDDRIAAAFTDSATSDTVAALIQEVESATRAASDAAEQARTVALDLQRLRQRPAPRTRHPV